MHKSYPKHIQNTVGKLSKLVRRMTLRDRERAEEFIREHFHSRYILLNREFFDWQYFKNPYNNERKFSFSIIEQGGRFLGFLGFVPYDLSVHGGRYTSGAALCNIMISRKCRTLGLGALLVKDIADNYNVVWGTGYKEKTGPMYEKMDWKYMDALKRYIIVLNGEKTALLTYGLSFKCATPFNVQKANFTNNIFSGVRTIERFTADVGELWEELRSKYPIGVKRDCYYLNWRYTDHPKFNYTILESRASGKLDGYIVFRSEEAFEEEEKARYTAGRIVDFVARDAAEIGLLSGALNYMYRRGAVLVDYFCTGQFHRESLKELGFICAEEEFYKDVPRRLRPIDRHRFNIINFIVHVNQNEKYPEPFLNSNNWYITSGDGDTDRPN